LQQEHKARQTPVVDIQDISLAPKEDKL
jgi:hypothetical protein